MLSAEESRAAVAMSIRNPKNGLLDPKELLCNSLRSYAIAVAKKEVEKAGEKGRGTNVPPLHIKSEHTLDNFRGKCPVIVPTFFTATA